MKLDAALAATLSHWLDATDVNRLELSGPDGTSLVLGRASSPQIREASGAMPAVGATVTEVPSPSLGVFLDRHPLAAAPLVEVGDVVEVGDALGCLQVGALLMPVRATEAGIVAERIAEPGALVGYGAPLFHLQPLPPWDRP